MRPSTTCVCWTWPLRRPPSPSPPGRWCRWRCGLGGGWGWGRGKGEGMGEQEETEALIRPAEGGGTSASLIPMLHVLLLRSCSGRRLGRWNAHMGRPAAAAGRRPLNLHCCRTSLPLHTSPAAPLYCLDHSYPLRLFQVLRASYFTKLPVTQLAVTRTARGVTARQILMSTPSGESRCWLSTPQRGALPPAARLGP